jgi:hypothetical protein
MKPTLLLAALALLTATAGTCMAMISVETVTPARAKELGIEVRGIANGPSEAWIELEFRPEGKLDKFEHVSLEIRDGKQFQLGWTPLKSVRTGAGTVVTRVMGNRAFLENVTLRVVRGATGEVGHDLRVKDFVDLKALR